MLPDSNNAPTSGQKRPTHLAVSLANPLQLRKPVVGVDAWCVAVPWARMPEAAVDEDGETLPRKDDVGTNAHTVLSQPTVVTARKPE